MSNISKLAFIDPSARLGNDITIGPFCVVGPDVTLGDNCKLINNVTINGNTSIGRNNTFYANSVIGEAPQDLKYKGSPTETVIGDNNVFRENVTVHRGTELDSARTVIGSNCLFMVGCHIAHDCIVEDNVIIGNDTQLAGHVTIQKGAVVTALIGLHHFVTVGRYAYIGGLTPVRRDVPPFVKFSGDPNACRGINEEGLKRNGFTPDDIVLIKKTYRKLYKKGVNLTEALEDILDKEITNEHVQFFCQAIANTCKSPHARYKETLRKDQDESKLNRKSFEIRQ
ncbi:MAG: acyl-ACP--UDP-N-acetylglucosamine O-acyltransferase [Phycisphaerae bacterium]|nr:acyl-ACP--UDP-N-acetylglucosamine O-acyltransferase [Phycisphaerae bacterium]